MVYTITLSTIQYTLYSIQLYTKVDNVNIYTYSTWYSNKGPFINDVM